jgi:enterochelin esterase-like enzyme
LNDVNVTSKQLLTIGLMALILLNSCQRLTPTPEAPYAESLSPTTIISPTSTGQDHAVTGTLTPSPSATAVIPPTPSITPTPTSLACLFQGGKIEISSLPHELLPLPLEFRVYTPPCYDELPDRHYPVLYLIHGQSFNDDQWERLGAAETSDALIATDEIAPLIIIMPRDRVWTQPNEDMFGKVLVEALLPWIDENYRTKPVREFRAIGGLSRGGGWAVHLGLSQWELFGAIGGHSLAVFDSDAPYWINVWLDSIPAESMPRFYLDIGERDREIIMRSAEWFTNLLDQKNIPHEWHLYTGYHDEDYWRSHIEEYLRWYTSEW